MAAGSWRFAVSYSTSELRIWDTASGRKVAGWQPAGIVGRLQPGWPPTGLGREPVRVTDLESGQVVLSSRDKNTAICHLEPGRRSARVHVWLR